MFISTYIKIAIFLCISLGSAYITHKIDESNYLEQVNDQIRQAVEHETQVVNDQAAISQKTQKDKDELQNRYDVAITELRGLRQQSATQGNEPTTPSISSKGLRLLEPDAEVLIGFAKQCANTELERNDVINKYNALMVK